MHAAADAAHYRRLCDVHLNGGGGGCSANGVARLSNPLGDGPGRPRVWMFIACDGPKGSGPGPLPNWLQELVRLAVNASRRSASSDTAMSQPASRCDLDLVKT
jgi:hypothetical protein